MNCSALDAGRAEERNASRKSLRGAARIRILWAALPLLTACALPADRKVQEPAYTLENQGAGTAALAVSADSRSLASGGWSGRVSIRRLADGRQQAGFQAHSGEVVGLAFHGDRALLTAGWDGHLRKWTRSGRLLWDYHHNEGLSAMAVDSVSGRIAVGAHDGAIVLVDAHTGLAVTGWRAHHSRVRALAFSPGYDRLASADTGRTVKLWSPKDARLLWQSRSPSDARDLVFSPDGRWLYGGGWFDVFRWQTDGGALRALDTDHRGIVSGLDFMGVSGQLASVSRQTDSAVLIIDPDSGRTRRNLGKHALCGGRVVVTPDERYLISNSDDYSISVWNIGSEQR